MGDISVAFMSFSLCAWEIIIFLFFFLISKPKSKIYSRRNGKDNIKIYRKNMVLVNSKCSFLKYFFKAFSSSLQQQFPYLA